MPSIKLITLSLALASIAAARTNLAGCTSSTTGASIIYYVPGTGEICDFPDCGGGRAPPKTTNPACPNYQGTATYSPSFLPGFTGAPAVSQAGDGQVQATSAAAAAAPVSQIGDGQPQVPTGAPSITPPAAAPTKTAAAVSQINDGQPQAPQATSTPAPASTVSAVSQITDGQPQAPASAAAPASSAPASSAPAAPAQPSSVTVPAVSQITDGQPQAPKSTMMTTSVMYGNGTAQGPTTVSGVAAPTGTSSKPPSATFTGAASVFGFNKEVAGLAMGLAAGIAML